MDQLKPTPYRIRQCVLCNAQKTPGSKVFLCRFPLDPDRCGSWVKAVGIEELAYLPVKTLHNSRFLCGSHFERRYFGKSGKKLLQYAIPTLNLINPPLSDSLLLEFPCHTLKAAKKKHLKVLQDVTNTSKGTTQNIVIENAVVYDCIPLPSSSTVPHEKTFERIPVSQKEIKLQKTDNVRVNVSSYKRNVRSTSDEDSHLTAREKRLLQRLMKTKLSLKRLAHTSINLDNLKSEVLKELVLGALKNQTVKRHGKRWTLKKKIFALSMFKRSPKAYRYMQKLMPLPSSKTLQRLLKSIPIETGIHHNIIKIMKNKATDMDSLDRYCTLAFDEMALKKRLIYNEGTDEVDGFVDYGLGESMGRLNKIADHALVFMLQGIRRKYKQPVAHYFVQGTVPSDKLAIIIKQVIKALSEAGFKVIATVCDQGPTNIGALNLLRNMSGQATDNNYFYCPDKTYIIYDVPHLFKSIRNNFLKGGIMKLDGKTAKWQHLIQAEEKNRTFLDFPKLTQTIVNPTYKAKMRVKYAAHALSNTMKAVLKTMTWYLPQPSKEEFMQTAQVVEALDRLFDCTNGPSSPKDVKKGKRENVDRESNHIEKWNYYLKVIDSIIFLNSETLQPLNKVRCIKGYEITLKSLKDIWNFLDKEAGFEYLNLRQLNQDSLENLFGLIRQYSITNKNITCSHFTNAIKSGIISGLLGPQSRGSNCEKDSNKVLLLYNDITESQKNNPTAEDTLPTVVVEEITHPVLSLSEETNFSYYENALCSFEDQPIVYVSGYVAAKLLTKTACDACKYSLKIENPVDDPLYQYISFREWWKDKNSLTYPSIPLCNFVDKAQNIYNSEISHNLHIKNICQWSSLQMSTGNFDWFKCKNHFDEKTKHLVHVLSLLFVRKSCKIKNSLFLKCEQASDDQTKKAQQQGIAK